MGKLIVAFAILIATAMAVEKVSSYISPNDLKSWAPHTKYLYQDSKGEYELLDNETHDGGKTRHAFIIVNNSYDDMGWDFVYVSGDHAKSNDDALRNSSYYHAGMAEGWATAERIHQTYVSTVDPMSYDLHKEELGWIQEHIAFMKKNVVKKASSDSFWAKVGDLFSLMEGIADGFAKSKYAQTNKLSLSPHDIFILNFGNELDDVRRHFNITSLAMEKSQVLRSQHCSALVKVLPDDIFFSHDTWSIYDTMLRQYKTYAMETTVTMSGFAGTIASGDDWYMTSNALAVQETTNDYYDMELAVKYILPESVSEFLRVMAANFLAVDGKTWTDEFSRYNSGTYCNQYMVLDGKLFTPHVELPDGLFHVAEQMPGYIAKGDQTAVLRNQTYWASYNIPFYNEVYQKSGFARLEREQGTFWSYQKYARAEIFARNQSYVKDLDGMRKMMRFNEWQHDPLSKIPNCSYCHPNSPMLSIASRGDLVPKHAVLPHDHQYAQFFNGSAFGDIDSKITSAVMVKNMSATVICGPTHETQVPFKFSGSGYQRPIGLVDSFDFDWVTFNTPPLPPTQVNSNGDNHGLTGAAKGLIAFVVIFFVGCLVAIVIYRRRNQSSDDYQTLE